MIQYVGITQPVTIAVVYRPMGNVCTRFHNSYSATINFNLHQKLANYENIMSYDPIIDYRATYVYISLTQLTSLTLIDLDKKYYGLARLSSNFTS